MKSREVAFLLAAKDEWPPCEVEHLWLKQVGDLFEVRNFPFFVKGVAYEDKLRLTFNEKEEATRWEVVAHSKNSLIWIFQHRPDDTVEAFREISDA